MTTPDVWAAVDRLNVGYEQLRVMLGVAESGVGDVAGAATTLDERLTSTRAAIDVVVNGWSARVIQLEDRAATIENTHSTVVGGRIGPMEVEVQRLMAKVTAMEALMGQGGGARTGSSGGGTKEFVDLKQLRPEKLKEGIVFKKWRFGFENFCELVDPGMKTLLKEIGKISGEVTEEKVSAWLFGKDYQDLQRRLQNALAAYTEGEAARIVSTCKGDGMAAWQALCREYDLQTDANENKLLGELLGMVSRPATSLTELRQLMVELDARKTKLEEMSTIQNPVVPADKSLKAILIGILDGETRKVIGGELNGPGVTYRDARTKIAAHVTLNTGTMQTGGKKSDDMDLGRCAHGAAHEEEEASGEGAEGSEEERLAALKGGGKGGNRTCYECGGKGHFARDCWKKGGGKGGAIAPPPGMDGGKGKGYGKAQKGPRTGCFGCGGNHYQSDCPLKGGKGGGGGGYTKGKGKGMYPLMEWGESQGAPARLCSLSVHGGGQQRAGDKNNEGWKTVQEKKGPSVSGRTRPPMKERPVQKTKGGRFDALKETDGEDDIWEQYAAMVKSEKQMMEDDEKAMAKTDGGRLSGLWKAQNKRIEAIKSEGGWKKVRFTVDSGAGEVVMNDDELPGIKKTESQGSRAGLKYVTADGGTVENEGEKRFAGFVEKTWRQTGYNQWMRKEPTPKDLKVQICDVVRPLMAVKKMCQAGHRVVFDDEGSYAENKETGEIIEVEEIEGEYVMDVWVKDEGF